MPKYKAPVKYVASVQASSTFFLKILFRWTGSVWQKLYIDAFIFIALWIAINVTYTVYLQRNEKASTLRKFNSFVLHIKKIGDGVELTMVLGFFVSTVFRRWWQVAMTIPRTTAVAFALQSYTLFTENKVIARNIRTQVLRYLNLAWILAMRHMCPQICHRFNINESEKKQTCCQRLRNCCTCCGDEDEETFAIQSINNDKEVKKYCPGGLITRSEAKVIGKFVKNRQCDTEFLLPLQWANRLITKSSKARFFRSDGDLKDILKVVDEFRKALENLTTHNEIHIPLVYTQIVVIAVYSYCLAELFTTSSVPNENFNPMTITNMTMAQAASSYVSLVANNDGRDLPIYSIFKFVFFMGWFKTAVSLLNPLGSDREALPTSLMLSQNLETSYDIANDNGDFFPPWLTSDEEYERRLACEDLNTDDILLDTDEGNLEDEDVDIDGNEDTNDADGGESEKVKMMPV